MSDSWRDLSDSMRSARPVFIVGVQRSGTTALNYTLARHPTFLARGDLSPETRIFRRPGLARTILGQTGDRQRLLKYLLRDKDAARRIETMVAEILAGKDVPDARPQSVDRFVALGFDHVVRVFFAIAQEVRACRRLLEKTPIHVFCRDEILTTFPNARAIVCVRHPVGVFASCKKKIAALEREHPGVDAKARYPWLFASAEQFAEQNWLKRVEAAQAWLAKAPETAHLLRYEDLTADPKAAVAEICAFLGEPFAQADLFDAVPVAQDALGTPKTRARITANADRSREFVTDAERASIERAARPAIASLGYPH